MSDSVVTTTPLLNEDALGSIKSFDDALALLKDAQVDVVTTDDLGDGFRVCEDKNTLVKVPFVIVGMRFHDGEHGEFVILHVVTADGRKLIVNDGSAKSGIRAQCEQYARHGRTMGIICERGLVRSDYTYKDEESGKEKNATTYYLS